MRLGYLYSRYPVISQTFCDAEMLALERCGLKLEIGSIYPPLTSLRHEHISCLRAPIHYAPPQEILRISEKNAKIHRVYNGIDLEHFPTPAPTTINPVPRIISVGRFVAFKGFEHLIDACAELASRGVDFTCDIIGDGPLHDALRAKIDVLNLSSRINLLGSLSQRAVLEALQAADIFALASVTDAEGASDVFPTVILEAMASARPVVSTRLAGIPELVVGGQTGVLVSPEDTSALTQALEQLLYDT